jgi:hypothetical protein
MTATCPRVLTFLAPDRLSLGVTQAKVFDLSPNAPIIKAGADPKGMVWAVEARITDTLTVVGLQDAGVYRYERNRAFEVAGVMPNPFAE